jgi:hypothetical protein
MSLYLHDMKPILRTGANHTPLLLRYDADATVAALRGTDSANLHWHKSVIVTRVYRDAVRIGIGRDVLQPEVASGINDTQNRAIGHVS